jgi:glucose/mannose transport system substrate-binding protein
LLAAAFAAAPVHAAPTVEVLHWWTAAGEAAAMRVVQDAFEKAGGKWIDAPVAAGGGAAAREVLKKRVAAGNPPDAALMQAGKNIWTWADAGALSDLDDVAKAERWDKKLPGFLLERLKNDGKFVAAPLNINRLNAFFVNPAVLKKAGVAITPDWPRDWNDFNAAADKIQKAGLIPLAHGGQPWQDQMLFSMTVLGIGGPDFYKKALMDRDPAALTGPTMVKVFDQMRRLKGYTDKASAGREWNQSTDLLIRGEAGMQIMGDWVRGEFAAAGKKPGVDFLCLASPGSAGAFISSTDVFAVFKVSGKDRIEGQKLLGRVLMDADVQKRFNMLKGSIPARLDIPKDSFDACGRRTMEDLALADARGIAIPGAGARTVDNGFSKAFDDIVVSHFNSGMTSQEAVRRVGEALKAAQTR